jgi:hypothetical protein
MLNELSEHLKGPDPRCVRILNGYIYGQGLLGLRVTRHMQKLVLTALEMSI